MNNLIKFFLENKIYNVIIGILFLVLGIYTHELSFVYKSILLSRILPVIFFSIGISLFKLVLLSQTDINLTTMFLKSLIFVCGIILISKILDIVKVSANPLLRSILLISTIFLLSNIFKNKK
ncbi:hypothetical protein Q428_14905 [Fervidicella metallireducens AeB]|uniref:Uncharacterized protein n=1 Tax=Fervidicella metallireducens AeB TaxID=1403537 RepID=A0A017RTE6_9CLOT|nr:hypothetical protein Q428_14905 [Fervidicella metallireducens AeB]